MQNTFLDKLMRLLRERGEWLPRIVRGTLLFYFTRMYRLFIPFSRNIKIGLNVRVQWPTCLLAEYPLSKILVENNCIIYENAMIEAYGRGEITIGENSVIGDNRIYSRGKILLGKRLVTSWNVLMQDFDPHPIDPELRSRQINDLVRQFSPRFDIGRTHSKDILPFDFSPGEIIIGDDVWIGANAIILKDVKIN